MFRFKAYVVVRSEEYVVVLRNDEQFVQRRR